MSVFINLAQYAATVEAIAKINERAAKKGLAGHLTLVEGEHREIEKCDHDASITCDAARATSFGAHHIEEQVEVSIEGEAPKFAGWTFAARIDRVEDTYTLATAPGVEYVDRSLVSTLGHCDHCGTDRARKTTYLLQGEGGALVQVGSTCIKDFLGWDGKIAWLDVQEVSEYTDGSGFYVAPRYAVEDVVRTAIASVRDRGFVSTQVYSQMSTRSHVALAFDSTQYMKERERREKARLIALANEVSDQDVADLLGFILSEDFNGQSTYVDNLKAIASCKFITEAQFGLLASAPQAHAKHLGQVAARAAKKASEWVGDEGEKVTLAITITKISNVGSYSYAGPDSYLIIGQTEEGEIVKTFTTAGWSRDVEVGSTITLQATVKKHEEYAGTKQTAVTRAKKVA